MHPLHFIYSFVLCTLLPVFAYAVNNDLNGKECRTHFSTEPPDPTQLNHTRTQIAKNTSSKIQGTALAAQQLIRTLKDPFTNFHPLNVHLDYEQKLARVWNDPSLMEKVPSFLKNFFPKEVQLINFTQPFSNGEYLVKIGPKNGLIARLSFNHSGRTSYTNVVFPVNAATQNFVNSVRATNIDEAPIKKYLVSTEAKAAVIFLHGGGTTSTGAHAAMTYIDHLTPYGVDVVGIDLPFHGGGDREFMPSAFETVKYITSFIKEFIPNNIDVYIVGHSLGGTLALQSAFMSRDKKQFLNQIKGVVSLSPGLNAESIDQFLKRSNEALQRKLEAPEAEKRIKEDMVFNGKISPLGEIQTLFQILTSEHEFSDSKKFENILPTLLIVGKYDPLVYFGFEDLFNQLQEQLGKQPYHKFVLLDEELNGETLEIEKVGHLITQFFNKVDKDRKPIVIAEILKFIEESSNVKLQKQERLITLETSEDVNSKKEVFLNNQILNNFQRFLQPFVNDLAFRDFADHFSQHVLFAVGEKQNQHQENMIDQFKKLQNLIKIQTPDSHLKNLLIDMLNIVEENPLKKSLSDFKAYSEDYESDFKDNLLITQPSQQYPFVFHPQYLSDLHQYSEKVEQNKQSISTKEVRHMTLQLLNHLLLKLEPTPTTDYLKAHPDPSKYLEQKYILPENTKKVVLESVKEIKKLEEQINKREVASTDEKNIKKEQKDIYKNIIGKIQSFSKAQHYFLLAKSILEILDAGIKLPITIDHFFTEKIVTKLSELKNSMSNAYISTLKNELKDIDELIKIVQSKRKGSDKKIEQLIENLSSTPIISISENLYQLIGSFYDLFEGYKILSSILENFNKEGLAKTNQHLSKKEEAYIEEKLGNTVNNILKFAQTALLENHFKHWVKDGNLRKSLNKFKRGLKWIKQDQIPSQFKSNHDIIKLFFRDLYINADGISKIEDLLIDKSSFDKSDVLQKILKLIQTHSSLYAHLEIQQIIRLYKIPQRIEELTSKKEKNDNNSKSNTSTKDILKMIANQLNSSSFNKEELERTTIQLLSKIFQDIDNNTPTFPYNPIEKDLISALKKRGKGDNFLKILEKSRIFNKEEVRTAYETIKDGNNHEKGLFIPKDESTSSRLTPVVERIKKHRKDIEEVEKKKSELKKKNQNLERKVHKDIKLIRNFINKVILKYSPKNSSLKKEFLEQNELKNKMLELNSNLVDVTITHSFKNEDINQIDDVLPWLPKRESIEADSQNAQQSHHKWKVAEKKYVESVILHMMEIYPKSVIFEAKDSELSDFRMEDVQNAISNIYQKTSPSLLDQRQLFHDENSYSSLQQYTKDLATLESQLTKLKSALAKEMVEYFNRSPGLVLSTIQAINLKALQPDDPITRQLNAINHVIEGYHSSAKDLPALPHENY